jgi:hypothetical protein
MSAFRGKDHPVIPGKDDRRLPTADRRQGLGIQQAMAAVGGRLTAVVVALALTPLALIAHSYKFVNDDQILYIPFLRRRLDPALYPGDYFFNQSQASLSLFEDVLIWPVRLLGLEWAMLLGYLLAQAVILLCLYALAVRLVSRRAAYLAMILFFLPISIGGTFVRTYDNYFNPRTLTLPLGLLTLIALWERRPWGAAILVSLHLLLHPLSGLHTWLVAALLLAWWVWKGYVPARSLIGPAALLLGVLGVLAWSSGGSGALWLDPTWRAVLWKRTPYVFLASWKTEDWISLGIYLALGLVGWSGRRRSASLRDRDPRTRDLSLAVLVVALGTTLAVALGVDWLGLAPLAQLQLARSWRLVIALAVIFGADAVFVLYERGGWGGYLAAACLAVAIYFDRADPEWQPVFAVLLVAILVARAVEDRWGREWAAWVLALGGMGVAAPALLAAWSVTDGWGERWRLPEEALWPVILIFGLLLIVRTLRGAQTRALADWAGMGIGGALALAALFPLAGEWHQRNWSDYLNDRLQLPVSDAWMSPTFRAWRDVQLWAAAHTPPDARFATDPDEKGFRVFSQRSPIVEEKDGAPAMFNRAYALEWERRMGAMAAAGVVDPDKKTELTGFSAEGLMALHRLYPFDYVVGQQPQSLPWPEVYRNQVFIVYAWPEQE